MSDKKDTKHTELSNKKLKNTSHKDTDASHTRVMNDGHQQRHDEIKNIVLKHLAKYKNELKDDKKTTFKPVAIPLKELHSIAGNGGFVLEVVGQEEGKEDSQKVKDQREQITSTVQQIVNNIKTDGERILVVNVNTPAVDLKKNFDPEQLQYMKNDIYHNIQKQMGTDFPEEIEEQWGTAFKTMMEIVDAQKKTPK